MSFWDSLHFGVSLKRWTLSFVISCIIFKIWRKNLKILRMIFCYIGDTVSMAQVFCFLKCICNASIYMHQLLKYPSLVWFVSYLMFVFVATFLVILLLSTHTTRRNSMHFCMNNKHNMFTLSYKQVQEFGGYVKDE